MIFPRAAALLLPLLTLGCAPATTFRSVKAPDADPARRRVIVRSDLVNPKAGASFGPAFAQAFNARLGELLEACGARSTVVERAGVEGDWRAFLKAADGFKPDTIMSLEKKKGLVGAGGLTYATLGVDLFDAAAVPDLAKYLGAKGQLKPVWGAEVGFSRGGTAIPIEKRGRALAEELTNQMKGDGLFPGCPKVGLSSQNAAGGAEASPGARPFGVLLRLGFDFGGDELVKVVWDDGSEKTIKAGQLAYLSGGVLYHPPAPYAVEATLGYKFDQASGSNGTIGFTRVPLDLIVSFAKSGLRLGGGPTFHFGPKFECDATGVPNCPLTVEYDTAIGGILQAAYGFGSSSGYELGVRYTFIEYKTGPYALDGSGFGFFLGGWL